MAASTARDAAADAREMGRGRAARVWHREYWDRYIRDDAHYEHVFAYIHENPVRAGLVARPDAWPWSSAAREAGDRE